MEVEDSGRDLRERIRSQVEDSRSSQREGLRATKRPFLSEVVEGLTLLSSEELKSLALSLKNKISLVEGLTVVTHFVQVTREALQRISASASLSQKHIDAVLSVDAALPTLIGYLSGDDAGMQLESAACITNLVCGNHKSTIRVARAAGPYLLLYAHSSHSHTLQVQCFWAVGNISRDCDKCCRLLSQQGFQSAITSSLPLVSIQEEEGDDSLCYPSLCPIRLSSQCF
ncbi:unnamed protein product [Darwinula stevensoni]|uniref:Uncharacterized protein n=1 Tax=Darwinula stevensoni TaxID=69355 RepID=A0A7R8XBT3_9CRUS|nr:unnamed protein product [Darwinula stevensoni]CAG0888123.1 unnamed protein product [Darwinula stevensoni]